MRRAVLPLISALCALAFAATGCGDGDDAASRRARQLREAAEGAGLPDDVVELLETAAAAVGETFRVTYDLGDEAGGTAALTQAPPRRRVDLSTTVDGRSVGRSLIVDGDRATVCERADRQWACRAAGRGDDVPGPFGEEQLDAVVRDLAAAKGAYDFRISEREVAGVEARCLVTKLRPGREPSEELGAAGTLCVSDEGVPLLVETPIATLRAVDYTTDVPDDRFDLPAKIQR